MRYIVALWTEGRTELPPLAGTSWMMDRDLDLGFGFGKGKSICGGSAWDGGEGHPENGNRVSRWKRGR